MTYAAEILTIGDELLRGNALNTNAQYLGRELTQLGFSVQNQVACPDSIPAISQKLSEALSRSHLLILSGGLGPTPDDVTREAIGDFLKVPLVFSKSQYSRIQFYYRKHGHAIPLMVRKEAFYPETATPLINRFGIALGFYIEYSGRLIIVLPGVPKELENMFRELVRPLLKRHFKGLNPKPKLIAKIVGLSEPAIMTKLGRDFFDEAFDFGIYPEAGEVSIRIYAGTPKLIQRLKAKIKKRLGQSVYAYEECSLAEALGKIFSQQRKSLSVAESCTGGLLSSELTKIPGSSRYFKGGVTVYSNSVKETLGVDKALIKKRGAVSQEVALVLAKAVARQMGSTYGIGITGIAGPDGGSREKPVGLVYIAVAGPKGTSVYKNIFWGDRIQIQTKSVKKALEYLWRRMR